jgi:hypothetical protein
LPYHLVGSTFSSGIRRRRLALSTRDSPNGLPGGVVHNAHTPCRGWTRAAGPLPRKGPPNSIRPRAQAPAQSIMPTFSAPSGKVVCALFRLKKGRFRHFLKAPVFQCVEPTTSCRARPLLRNALRGRKSFHWNRWSGAVQKLCETHKAIFRPSPPPPCEHL